MTPQSKWNAAMSVLILTSSLQVCYIWWMCNPYVQCCGWHFFFLVTISLVKTSEPCILHHIKQLHSNRWSCESLIDWIPRIFHQDLLPRYCRLKLRVLFSSSNAYSSPSFSLREIFSQTILAVSFKAPFSTAFLLISCIVELKVFLLLVKNPLLPYKPKYITQSHEAASILLEGKKFLKCLWVTLKGSNASLL